MTAWLKYTCTALLTATFCLGGLSLGIGCNKSDGSGDGGESVKRRNKERYREPVRDRPVQGDESSRLVVPERTAHA